MPVQAVRQFRGDKHPANGVAYRCAAHGILFLRRIKPAVAAASIVHPSVAVTHETSHGGFEDALDDDHQNQVYYDIKYSSHSQSLRANVQRAAAGAGPGWPLACAVAVPRACSSSPNPG